MASLTAPAASSPPPFLTRLGLHPSSDTVTDTSASLPIYVPPLNFAIVSPTIYRSGFPRPENYSFLNALELKSILYLADQDFREDTLQWATTHDLNIFHFRVESNKEPFVECNADAMGKALVAALDENNWPILIHCNRGRHRAGLLCALVRRVQGWSLTMALDEYKRFFGNANGEGKSTARLGDHEWIEAFDISALEPALEHQT